MLADLVVCYQVVWEYFCGTLLPNGALFDLAFEEAISNAVSHTEKPNPTVEVTVTQPENMEQIQITVSDDGPGIPEPEQEIIKKGEELPLVHSSGIGLWVIKWVITSLGGEFQINNKDPQGTVLTFRLPVTREKSNNETNDTTN